MFKLHTKKSKDESPARWTHTVMNWIPEGFLKTGEAKTEMT